MFCHVYSCKSFKVLKDWKKNIRSVGFVYFVALCAFSCTREEPGTLNLGLMDSDPNLCLSDSEPGIYRWDLGSSGPFQPHLLCAVSVVASLLSLPPGADGHGWLRTHGQLQLCGTLCSRRGTAKVRAMDCLC